MPFFYYVAAFGLVSCVISVLVLRPFASQIVKWLFDRKKTLPVRVLDTGWHVPPVVFAILVAFLSFEDHTVMGLTACFIFVLCWPLVGAFVLRFAGSSLVFEPSFRLEGRGVVRCRDGALLELDSCVARTASVSVSRWSLGGSFAVLEVWQGGICVGRNFYRENEDFVRDQDVLVTQLGVPSSDLCLVCPGPLCDRVIRIHPDWSRIAFSKTLSPALTVFWNTRVRRCVDEKLGCPVDGDDLRDLLEKVEADVQQVRECLDRMAADGVERPEVGGVEIGFRLDYEGGFETQVGALKSLANRGEELYVVPCERFWEFLSDCRGDGDQPFPLRMSDFEGLDASPGIRTVQRTWERSESDGATEDDAISEIVATCVKASRREGNALRVIREAERRLGFTFPDALTEYYRACDGFDFPDGYTRFLSLETAISMGVSMGWGPQSGPWNYLPVFDDYTEAPICVLCASPLRGMLARVPREGAPTLFAPSLGHFLKTMAVEGQLEDTFTAVEVAETFTVGGAQGLEIQAGLQKVVAITDDEKVRTAAFSFGHSLGYDLT